MKNKYLKYIILLIFFLEINTSLLANEYTFNSKEINISSDGNLINASKGVATSLINDNKIIAESFQYNNNTSIFLANNVIAKLNKDIIKITSDKLLYNKILSLITVSGNVKINDSSKNITFKSEKFFFDTNNQTIKSNTNTKIIDEFGNLFVVSDFVYEINNSLIKINEAQLTTLEKNIYKIKKANINLVSKTIVGEDIFIDFKNIAFREGNEPRLEGKSISLNSENTEIKDGAFTACKKNDSCPPWELTAKNIKHDKKNKTIYYDKAWLKIYDTPVLYFPKFFHPDPTVKRQSGFLMPSFESSTSIGSSLSVPYYHLLSSNRDVTIKPKFFQKNKILIQSEYRHVSKNSNNIFDFSLLNRNNSSSKTHFFSRSKKKINIKNFDESELTLQLQSTSNDTYLKSYKLKSPLILDNNSLTSTIGLKTSNDDTSFDINFYAYENLSKNKNDRFEFVYPSYNIVKLLDNKSNYEGDLSFASTGFIKNYNTNVYENVIINDFAYNSNPKFTENGLKNNFNILLKNINTKGVKSEEYKDSVNHKIASIVEFNSSYPLKKNNGQYKNTLSPIVSLKYSPNNSKNMSSTERRIDVNNIFSINRIMADDTVEGGASLTYGFEFSKLINDKQFFESKIANVFRLKENKNLPNNNNLGKKTSDIIGEINFNPYDVLNIGYNFSIDENIKDQNYQMLDATVKLNKFTSRFEYLNENNTVKNESYLSNKTVYNFSNSKSLSYETRRNKETKHTEFYNLIYEYQNDCLTAAIEYNKDYYSDRDFKPEENLFFKLTIVPFGTTSSPNLK